MEHPDPPHPLENQPLVHYQLPITLDGFDQPMQFHCTQCGQDHISVLRYEAGNHTWLCCCGLCCFTIILGLLPFYLKDCKDVTHYCPACSARVGESKFKAFTI